MNGKGPLSCQNYTVPKLSLSILTVPPNHTYPAAGIKINTAGYKIKDLGFACTPISNGYCLFSVSDSLAKMLVIEKEGDITPAIAGGSYTGTTTIYPLLASSSDGGATWAYTIQKGMTLPTDYSSNGNFGSTSCSGANCIAGGSYRDTTNTEYPLLATSSDGGAAWAYKIEKDMTLPTDYSSTGLFYSTSCSGTNCVAGGSYRDALSTTKCNSGYKPNNS